MFCHLYSTMVNMCHKISKRNDLTYFPITPFISNLIGSLGLELISLYVWLSLRLAVSVHRSAGFGSHVSDVIFDR